MHGQKGVSSKGAGIAGNASMTEYNVCVIVIAPQHMIGVILPAKPHMSESTHLSWADIVNELQA